MWHLLPETPLPDQRCAVCGTRSRLVASHLSVCSNCIRVRWEAAHPVIRAAHSASRSTFGLPSTPPRAKNETKCLLCGHGCQIAEGERGLGA